MPDWSSYLTLSAGHIILAWNLLAVIIMGWDKLIAKSRNGRRTGPRRVPESVLLGMAVAMGAGGIWAGMYLFRHKTQHRVFTVGVPLAFLLNAMVLKWLGLSIG